MKRLRPRSTDWALRSPKLAAASSITIPQAVIDGLVAACLLEHLPLGHLVPRAELLPPESLRTFNVDPRWMLHLLAGALSVGRSLASDHIQDAQVFTELVTQVAVAAGMVSPDGQHTLFSGQPLSGFVLRSEVIRGWPKLEVRGYASIHPMPNEAPLPCVQWRILADGMMIALFVGAMGSFEIREPGECLHFGMEQSGPSGQKMLRFIAGPGSNLPGQSLGPSSRTNVVQRGQGVLRVARSAATLQAALQTFKANESSDGTPRPFTSAEWALQMLEGAQSVAFEMTPVASRSSSQPLNHEEIPQ